MKPAPDRHKHVAIVGAGPGGLTAAMLLAHRGLRVTVFEQADQVGGRNSELRLGPYRFDLGPTFLMMKFILDEVFQETGRRSQDYLDCRRLDPMYVLRFGDAEIRATDDLPRMREQIARLFPGQERGFDRLLHVERLRFRRMYPCLQKDYGTLGSMLSPPLLKALPVLGLGRTMHQALSGYFGQERLRLAFTFQSKYLGMSPWDCPAAFMIIPYVEYAAGIYHVRGGLSRIAQAQARVVAECGGEIHLGAAVRRVLVDGRAATGVELEDGTRIAADAVIINADFAHAMTRLFEPGVLRKYRPDKLRRRGYSCSTFMLYLGLDRVYPLEHHTIVFAEDYRKFVDDISRRGSVGSDLSFYVRNASVTDPDLAPPGHSAVYVLVPVPNNSSGIDWAARAPEFRAGVLDSLERRAGMTGLRGHIVAERVITPADWEAGSVFLGATFNLRHTLSQMLYFRPHNEFEELRNCYLVGGGTHPGSGLPTIYESGRISANLLCRRWRVAFDPPGPPPAEVLDPLSRPAGGTGA